MRQLFDQDTCKVLVAAAAPFLVWGSELEMILKLMAGAGACIYISLKITYLIKNKGKGDE